MPILAVVVLVLGVLVGTSILRLESIKDGMADTDERLASALEQQQELSARLEDLRVSSRNVQAELEQLQKRMAEEPDNAKVVKRAAPSVFTVSTPTGTGSGFVASAGPAGSRLVTNFHVIASSYVNGDRTVEILREQTTYEGRVVEVSEDNDLAVISLDQRLPALKMARPEPEVGDTLLVLGSPLGLGGTVTSGIASAFRELNGLTYLQFSAPISPGNSGGPVLNESGQVVGVAVLKSADSGAEGLGFAIPTARLCAAVSVC